MGNWTAGLVAPRMAAENPASIQTARALEQPRDFHFAVTWVTLFAHLDLIESTGPWHRLEPSPVLALVPVVTAAPLVEQPPRQDSAAAWEMVVPKMIRTGTGDFTPVEASEDNR
jgi:hypothetical protein